MEKRRGHRRKRDGMRMDIFNRRKKTRKTRINTFSWNMKKSMKVYCVHVTE